MPIYEYACPDCGAVFDRLRRYAEREDAPNCPECGAATRPMLSAAAVHGSASSGKLPIAAACDAGPACCGGGCGAMN
ncbi:MAG: zinc ribbon domain-containing protein [Gemmatimonadetes bacterium]|nr:zinc ribbon domain-containing protein [Gemmatimonadota bacterium]